MTSTLSKSPPAFEGITETTTPPEAESKGTFEVPSLGGIRALACLLVFFGHAVPDRYSRYVPPAFGVTVFFVLSGYLITTLLRREFEKTGRNSLKAFYARRALRIWPPFYIVLALTTVLTITHVLEGHVSVSAFLALAGHVGNYWRIYRGLDDTPNGTNVYWSLGVEEHFYLLFPLVYVTLRRLGLSAGRQAVALLGLATAVCLWRVVLVAFFGADSERIVHASDTRFDAILVGCMLAVWGNPALDPTRLSRATWTLGLFPASLVLLVVINMVGGEFFHLTFRYLLQALLLWIAFTVAVRFPDFAPMRLLNTAPLKFLGTISYTFYLSHRAILNFYRGRTSLEWVPRTAAALTTTLLFAYAMYRLVEQPCARLRKRFAHGSELP